MSYDGVIFDKDGVLIDSMSDDFEWANRIRESFYESHDIPMEAANKAMFAQKKRFLEHLASKGPGISGVQEVEIRVAERKIERIEKGQIKLFPEVKQVLKSIELPKALVSNSSYRATSFTVKHFDIEKHFEEVFSPSLDDLHRYHEIKKPNSHMISKVLHETEMKNPLMVGDTSDDILAARNAGIDCCLVNAYKDYSELHPEHEIDRLKKLPEILN